MKKLFLFLSVLAIGFSSCTKNDDDTNNPNYHIDGITDLVITKEYTQFPVYPVLNLTVVYENSQQERVKLSLENVPQGLSYRISTSTGIPTFGTNISFVDSGVATGSYPIKLVGYGEVSGRREFYFNMTVKPVPDCAEQLLGNYLSNSMCDSVTSIQTVSRVQGTTNTILINNVDNVGRSLKATVDCNAKLLVINPQTVGGFTYSGSGDFNTVGTQRKINLTLQKVGSSGTTTCSYLLQR